MFVDYFYFRRLGSRTSVQDSVVLGIYYLCVAVCFILSTSFHTFSDHSSGMHTFGNQLDHLGIVLVMWGSGISAAHFAFRCQISTRCTYFALLSAVAFGCGLFTLRPKFRRPAYRTVRFLMYVALGASLFLPVTHGLLSYGATDLEEMMGLWSFFGLGVINFSGAALYAARIPERWFPVKFDLIGQSHNWMHVLVLAGALVRLRGLLQVMDAWEEGGALYGSCDNLL